MNNGAIRSLIFSFRHMICLVWKTEKTEKRGFCFKVILLNNSKKAILIVKLKITTAILFLKFSDAMLKQNLCIELAPP